MPTTGRAACSAGQASRPSKASGSTDGSQKQQRSEKTRSAQPYVPPRRDSSAAAGTTAQRPALKGRAYSAPMIPKTGHNDPDSNDTFDALQVAESGDTDEIALDPFFQRYNFPHGDGTGEPANPNPPRDSSSDTEGPMSPTHLKQQRISGVGIAEALSSPIPRSPRPGSDANSILEINIGVLGAEGVGKTTFVQRILELKTPPNSAFSARKMAIDGAIYLVRLVELPFDDIIIGEDDCITWPDTIDDLATPRIDGAFAIYDVMNQETLADVPEILNAIQKATIPFALVSWKCDNHPAHRQVDPAVVEQRAKAFLGDIFTFQSSEAAHDVQKRCLSVMLRAIVSTKDERPKTANARRRANSSAIRQESQRQVWTKGHERASSEYSGSRLKLEGDGKYPSNRKPNPRLPGGTTQQTFLDLEESPGYDSADSEDHGSDIDYQSIITDIPSDEKGYTFDQLVNRLLAQPLSKNDSKFSAVFLALYRQFAAPGQLLDAIITRFKALARDRKPALMRISTQLRHLAILEQWVSCYPGDFAYPSTRRKMRNFVARLQGNRIFSVAAREMITDLEVVTEDDDTDWACCDKARDKGEPSKPFPSANSVLDEDSDEDYAKLLNSVTLTSDIEKELLSPATTRSTSLSITGSTASSSQTMLNGIESAQRLAKGLVPNPRVTLTKVQWHHLFNVDDDIIARELTRIDWVMFSSIRPRDLIRDVSLNAEQKKQCKSLENVNRMTEHFNHLSHWVTNYMLLRDKPKHRALMLAKFMKIARKLRELNNYNALGAVLAGINNTAIHRLAATRELLPQDVAKDFMKLEILMGTQKSHFAYRLAWDNSSGERIPYLPLLRRDLVSAAQGNSTFVGDRKSQDSSVAVHPGTAVFTGRAESREAPAGGVAARERINWRKFEIMGEVIVGVQRAQGTPYPPLQKNDEVRSLLLDVKLVEDDEDLYDRSVSLEAPAASSTQRRFNWFGK